MSLFSRGDGGGGDQDPIGGLGGPEEIREVGRTQTLAVGTLACPACDAPIHPGPHRLRPSGVLVCPFCGTEGRVRDFLTLGAPTRPAHVVVKVRAPRSPRWHRGPAPGRPSPGGEPRTPSA